MRTVKTMLLAMTAIAALAFAIPAGASASNWKENGKELTKGLQWSEEKAPLQSEAVLSIEGSLDYSIGPNCSSVSGVLALEPGTSQGLSGLTVAPASCKIIGSMAALGCKSATSVTSNTFPAVKAVEVEGVRKINLENVSLTYQLTGTGLCAGGIKFTATGTIVATPNSSSSISSLTLSGLLKSTSGTNGTVGGTQAVSPAGKYGIIAKGGGNTINGNLSFSGGTNCPITGSIDLEPGSTGKVTGMSWKTAECSVFGGFSASGCTGVSSVVPNNLPWTIHDEGTKIKISEMSYTMTLKGSGACASGVTLAFKGDMFATPENVNAISALTLKGSLVANGTTVYSVEGNANWAPPGVFGL